MSIFNGTIGDKATQPGAIVTPAEVLEYARTMGSATNPTAIDEHFGLKRGEYGKLIAALKRNAVAAADKATAAALAAHKAKTGSEPPRERQLFVSREMQARALAALDLPAIGRKPRASAVATAVAVDAAAVQFAADMFSEAPTEAPAGPTTEKRAANRK